MFQRGSLQEVEKRYRNVEFRVYFDQKTGLLTADLRTGEKYHVRELKSGESIGDFKYSNILVGKAVYVIRNRVA